MLLFAIAKMRCIMLRTVILIIIVGLFLSGCSKYRWSVHQTQQKYQSCLSEYQNSKITSPDKLVLIDKTSSPNNFIVTNNSDELYYIDYNKSYLVLNQQTHRVVSGDSKVVHSDMIQPNIPIAPHSRTSISFYSPEIVDMNKNINQYVCENTEIWFSSLSIFFTTDNNSSFRVEIKKPSCSLTPPEKPIYCFETEITPAKKYSCYATAIFYGGSCWVPATQSDKDYAINQFKSKYFFLENYSNDDLVVDYIGRK